ncbi:zf-HC2 domain-containing protein [Agromyces laixinhei]|uniref:zf-HC2 domain-containing protein n=1 Tax=Agromyces laixinhei TaxID=2585717 RepID=UPI00111790B9|nr:zf-HC2 domain-containing protein [Agromyces laixinhei]
MSDCGCDKARAELEEYLHNELRGPDASDIRDHVAGCADCQAELRVGVAITEVVQRACRESAPEQLRVQVLSQIRLYQSTHTVA